MTTTTADPATAATAHPSAGAPLRLRLAALPDAPAARESVARLLVPEQRRCA